MTALPSISTITLPSLTYTIGDANKQIQMINNGDTHIVQKKMSTDILLPPILPTNSPPSLPTSPSYSSCSSLSVSSLPSSPDSVPDVSFNYVQATKKRGSIESLLNSGSELIALEREDQLNRIHFNKIDKLHTTVTKRPRFSPAPYSKQQALDNVRHTKGLRLFSKQVCDKVAEKGITTYNEVADELTAEIQQHSTTNIDQKNIRRRVYDALNVLMAMDMIVKDRKQIKWLGVPQQPSIDSLEREIQQEEIRQRHLLASVQESKNILNNTLEDFARLEKLVKRNQQQQIQQQTEAVVHLPFFMVSCSENIHTHFTHSKEAVLDILSSSYKIHHDLDVLAGLWPSQAVAS